jgi:threonine/homoserine/homoserine lactone efflux protein
MEPILFKGILMGFSLSFLIGPLLFTLVQTSIENGIRAGFSVAFGIWFSDLIFVVSVVFFVEKLDALVHLTGFEKWAGIIGGVLLIIFGGLNFLKKQSAQIASKPLESNNNWGHFMRGFLINTVNPFTVFFWLGITGTIIVPQHWVNFESLIFFVGMMGTLVLTDSLKVFLAQKISHWLTPKHIWQIRFTLGFLLIIFGISLIIRTL